MEESAWGYQSGGADDESTLRANVEAWRRISIRYRTMYDVSERSTATSVLGTPITTPVLIAPTAMQRLCHPDGELGMARGAQDAGTIMVVSSTATTGLQEVMAETPAPKWFQVYVYRNREQTQEVVSRAAKAGYKALVLTVDAPVLGRRERDIRNSFTLPQGMHIANAAVAGMDLVPQATSDASGLMQHFRGLHDPALTPADIGWLSQVSGLPVVVKGIVRGDDARRAVDNGAAAVIVSNHGGRQLDTAVPTAFALAEVAKSVGGSAEVYVDGGIRRGTDILKALALGARAVLVGRPALWALAVAGAAGVSHMLSLLTDEFDRAMALAGCTSVADVTSDLLVTDR